MKHMIRFYPYFVVLFRIIIGIVFVYASIDKIIDPAKFARNISNYHIVPFGLENIIAIILPWLELLIGLGLILGLYVDGGTFISAILLIIFNLLVMQAMIRGYNIECGCGLKEGEMVGWNKIFENFFLLLLSYLIYIRKKYLLEFLPKSAL